MKMNRLNKMALELVSVMLSLTFLLTQSSAAFAENPENRIRLAQNAPIIPQQDPNLLSFHPVNSLQIAQLNNTTIPLSNLTTQLNTLQVQLDRQHRQLSNPNMPVNNEAILTAANAETKKLIVQKLIAALKSDDYRARRCAAKLLGEIGDPDAIEPLLMAVGDNDQSVSRIADEASGKIIKKTYGISRHRIKDGLCFIGASLAEGAQVSDGPKAKMLKWFIEVSGNDNYSHSVRKETIESLFNMEDPELMGSIVETLKEKKPGIYLAFVETLGYIKNPKATRFLMAALESKDAKVRKAAAEGLASLAKSGVIKDPGQVIGALTRALIYKYRCNRIAIVSKASCDEHWNKRLSYKDRRTSITIVKALVATKSPKAIGPLKIALEYGDPYVREAAIKALNNMAVEVPEMRKDPRVVDFLMLALKDKKPDIRRAAVGVSYNIVENPKIVDFLMEAMKDKKLSIRISALGALEYCAFFRVDITKASGSIEEALKYKNSRIRRAAANVLGHMDDSKTVDLLVSALGREDNADVCIAIIKALEDTNSPKAISALTKELDNGNPRVCAAAVKALFNIEDSETFGLLASRLQINQAVGKGLNSKTALEILENFGNGYPNPKDSRIAQALKDEDLRVRTVTLGVLDKITDTKVATRTIGNLKSCSGIVGFIRKDGLCFINSSLAGSRRVQK